MDLDQEVSISSSPQLRTNAAEVPRIDWHEQVLATGVATT
jgi:hypothetical protein